MHLQPLDGRSGRRYRAWCCLWGPSHRWRLAYLRGRNGPPGRRDQPAWRLGDRFLRRNLAHLRARKDLPARQVRPRWHLDFLLVRLRPSRLWDRPGRLAQYDRRQQCLANRSIRSALAHLWSRRTRPGRADQPRRNLGHPADRPGRAHRPHLQAPEGLERRRSRLVVRRSRVFCIAVVDLRNRQRPARPPGAICFASSFCIAFLSVFCYIQYWCAANAAPPLDHRIFSQVEVIHLLPGAWPAKPDSRTP